MIKRSRSHLSTASESYFQHLRIAFRYGGKCFAAGLMAIVHGIVPALFTNLSERAR